MEEREIAPWSLMDMLAMNFRRVAVDCWGGGTSSVVVDEMREAGATGCFSILFFRNERRGIYNLSLRLSGFGFGYIYGRVFNVGEASLFFLPFWKRYI